MQKTLLILVVLHAALFGHVQAGIGLVESSGMKSLWSSMGGANWINKWNVMGDPCSNYGVTCDAAGSHVISIDLSNNNLVGSLPNGLLLVSALQNMDFSGNPGLVGSLQYATLSTLVNINLNSCKFNGSIPSAMFNSKRVTIDLSNNLITGPIPTLTSMPLLTSLRLSGNQLTAPLPSTLFTGAPNLVTLALSNNAIGGTVPTAVTSLTKLQTLELRGCGLTGSLPDFFDAMGALSTLDVGDNVITSGLPASLATATTLRKLYLDLNQITGSLSLLSSLSALQTLTVNNNLFSGGLPTLPNLVELNLSNLPSVSGTLDLTTMSLLSSFNMDNSAGVSIDGTYACARNAWTSCSALNANVCASTLAGCKCAGIVSLCGPATSSISSSSSMVSSSSSSIMSSSSSSIMSSSSSSIASSSSSIMSSTSSIVSSTLSSTSIISSSAVPSTSSSATATSISSTHAVVSSATSAYTTSSSMVATSSSSSRAARATVSIPDTSAADNANGANGPGNPQNNLPLIIAGAAGGVVLIGIATVLTFLIRRAKVHKKPKLVQIIDDKASTYSEGYIGNVLSHTNMVDLLSNSAIQGIARTTAVRGNITSFGPTGNTSVPFTIGVQNSTIPVYYHDQTSSLIQSSDQLSSEDTATLASSYNNSTYSSRAPSLLSLQRGATVSRSPSGLSRYLEMAASTTSIDSNAPLMLPTSFQRPKPLIAPKPSNASTAYQATLSPILHNDDEMNTSVKHL